MVKRPLGRKTPPTLHTPTIGDMMEQRHAGGLKRKLRSPFLYLSSPIQKAGGSPLMEKDKRKSPGHIMSGQKEM